MVGEQSRPAWTVYDAPISKRPSLISPIHSRLEACISMLRHIHVNCVVGGAIRGFGRLDNGRKAVFHHINVGLATADVVADELPPFDTASK
jgi:hypothetical protein